MNILEVKFIKCMKSHVDGASRKYILINVSPNRLYISLALAMSFLVHCGIFKISACQNV